MTDPHARCATVLFVVASATPGCKDLGVLLLRPLAAPLLAHALRG